MTTIDITELLNKINKYPEDTLLERMASYCEMNDIDPQEFGDMFSEDEYFKRKLWINCVENFQIKDVLLTNKINSVEGLDEW